MQPNTNVPKLSQETQQSNDSFSLSHNDIKSPQNQLGGGGIVVDDNPLIKNSSPIKKKRTKLIIIIIAITAICIIVATIATLFWRGTIYIGIKQPQQSVQLRTVVCGDEEIKRFNEAIHVMDQVAIGKGNGRDLVNEMKSKLKVLAESVAAKANNDSDATCQFILMYSARLNQDAVEVRKHFDQMEILNKEGVYVNNRINAGIDLTSNSPSDLQLSGGQGAGV